MAWSSSSVPASSGADVKTAARERGRARRVVSTWCHGVRGQTRGTCYPALRGAAWPLTRPPQPRQRLRRAPVRVRDGRRRQLCDQLVHRHVRRVGNIQVRERPPREAGARATAAAPIARHGVAGGDGAARKRACPPARARVARARPLKRVPAHTVLPPQQRRALGGRQRRGGHSAGEVTEHRPVCEWPCSDRVAPFYGHLLTCGAPRGCRPERTYQNDLNARKARMGLSVQVEVEASNNEIVRYSLDHSSRGGQLKIYRALACLQRTSSIAKQGTHAPLPQSQYSYCHLISLSVTPR
jgi:hypothetical protein